MDILIKITAYLYCVNAGYHLIYLDFSRYVSVIQDDLVTAWSVLKILQSVVLSVRALVISNGSASPWEKSRAFSNFVCFFS